MTIHPQLCHSRAGEGGFACKAIMLRPPHLLQKAPLIPALPYKCYPHCCRGFHLTATQPLLWLVSKNRHKVWFDIFKGALFLRNARLKLSNHKLDPTQHLQSSSQNPAFVHLHQEASIVSATACSFGIKGTSLQQLVFTPGGTKSTAVWFGWGFFCIGKN